MKTWQIYCAVHNETGQTYVGQTHRGFVRRQREHFSQSERGKQKRFHAALRVHGPEKFSWKLLVDGISDQEEANQLEQFWIVELNAHVSCGGYNLTWGGHGPYGFKHSESSRKKIGDRFRGIAKTEEQRRKMGEAISRARKGNMALGDSKIPKELMKICRLGNEAAYVSEVGIILIPPSQR